MMMEPMDELFKKKLEDRNLVFNEGHWEAAQQLLDDRDSRGAAIWWWRFGLTAIAFAMIVVFLLPFDTEQPPIEEKTHTASRTLQGGKAEQAVPQATSPVMGEQQVRERPAPLDRGSEISNPSDAPSSITSKRKAVAASNRSATKVGPTSENRATDSVQGSEVNPSSPIDASPSDDTAPPIAQDDQGAENPERALIAGFDQIPRLVFQVEGQEGRGSANMPERCWPVKNRWAVHTIIGGSLPAQDNQPGALLGLGVNWSGRGGWGIYAEGLYRIRQLSNLPTQMSLQRSYGFGVSESVFELQANSLHYADVNAGANYEFNRHRLHAGGGVSYLIGARGQLEQAQKGEEALDYSSAFAVSEGWISQEGLSRWLLRAHAGYEFELYPNVHLAGRIQYSFASILAATAQDQPRLSPVSFDLMLKYRLW